MAEVELKVQLRCKPRWWATPSMRAVVWVAPLIGVDRAERLGVWLAERSVRFEVIR